MRCPVCRAADNRTETCRRCKADLTLLFRLERQRDKHLATSEWFAGKGQADKTVSHARRAHTLNSGHESHRLLALGHLLRRDFANAWAAYQRIAASTES